jgi:hypothetical protein
MQLSLQISFSLSELSQLPRSLIPPADCVDNAYECISDDDCNDSDNDSDIDPHDLGHMLVAQYVINENLSDVAAKNLIELLQNKHVRNLDKVIYSLHY